MSPARSSRAARFISWRRSAPSSVTATGDAQTVRSPNTPQSVAYGSTKAFTLTSVTRLPRQRRRHVPGRRARGQHVHHRRFDRELHRGRHVRDPDFDRHAVCRCAREPLAEHRADRELRRDAGVHGHGELRLYARAPRWAARARRAASPAAHYTTGAVLGELRRVVHVDAQLGRATPAGLRESANRRARASRWMHRATSISVASPTAR